MEGNSSGHMIYVCLCSPISMMVSPRLLFTQQYCSYSDGGRSSLLSHVDTARVDCIHSSRGERQTTDNRAFLSQSTSFNSFYAIDVTVKQIIDIFCLQLLYNCNLQTRHSLSLSIKVIVHFYKHLVQSVYMNDFGS